MKHYFKEDQPHVFNRNNKELIEQKYEEFTERIKGEIENWSLKGSGWDIDRIMTAYVNVARYQPLRGGTYLPLPANLAKKVKKEGNNKREKQRQPMPEVGTQSSIISSKRRDSRGKTKQISGQQPHKLRRN